jgi:dethiobiotin synthetase
MPRIVFITGTDTGVGKTVFTALLLTHLRQQGVRALAMKPFCSGGLRDVHVLRQAQDGQLSAREINPWFFEVPVAPFVAASHAGIWVRMSEAVTRIRKIAARCDVLLVEGVGGLLVPLGNHYTVADLIGALDCPVILVARNKLGTVNHTLLTLAFLRRKAMHSCPVVLMNAATLDQSAATNARCIEEFGQQPVFMIPFLGRNSVQPGRLKKGAHQAKKTLAQIWERAIFTTAFRAGQRNA